LFYEGSCGLMSPVPGWAIPCLESSEISACWLSPKKPMMVPLVSSRRPWYLEQCLPSRTHLPRPRPDYECLGLPCLKLFYEGSCGLMSPVPGWAIPCLESSEISACWLSPKKPMMVPLVSSRRPWYLEQCLPSRTHLPRPRPDYECLGLPCLKWIRDSKSKLR
nr:hypothetical protein [Tanacetum cinerariifolium]